MAPQQTTPSTSMPSNMPGAMPGNMAPNAPVQSSSTTRQWVSDEAIAALQESQPQQTVGIQRVMQRSHMQYVVDVDIKGFFDNVNHRKLLRQLWTLGITDTKLIQVIKQMLKAPVLLPDGTVEYPQKGTPQGGILSPLLANVVLNELDWWIASQWHLQWKVMKKSPQMQIRKSGVRDLAHEYRDLRTTNLKEMYIVRYADDFKIFCKTRSDANKIKFATTQWLNHRLKLEVSENKTGITNLKRKYSEFLGFELKLREKSNKNVAKTKMCDKARLRAKEKLKEQIKAIQKPENDMQLFAGICKYNSTCALPAKVDTKKLQKTK